MRLTSMRVTTFCSVNALVKTRSPAPFSFQVIEKQLRLGTIETPPTTPDTDAVLTNSRDRQDSDAAAEASVNFEMAKRRASPPRGRPSGSPPRGRPGGKEMV